MTLPIEQSTTNGTSPDAVAITTTGQTPEATKESPAPPAPQSEHMIPKSRLDEEIAKRKLAEAELQKLTDAEEKRKRDDLSELDRLKIEKEEAETKRAEAEKQLADQRATIAAEKSFTSAVAKLNLDFFNEKARDNVFSKMDVSKPDGFEAALKELNEAEPYYFKVKEIPDLDSKRKDNNKNGNLTDADKAALKKRFNIK